MIQEFFIFLSLLITAYLTSVLFFKYVSPKEKKELKTQRDKLFKDVEKLLKKENFIEVIDTFDQIARLSEKLGELGIADEFKERANSIRRQLGQEVKGDLSASQEEVNAFIQLLLVGPYGESPDAVVIAAAPQAGGAQSKSLIEEGEEILARLARFKGEEGSEPTVTPIPTGSPPPSPPIGVSPPPKAPPAAASSSPRAPPMSPPTASPSPPSAVPTAPAVAVPSPPSAVPTAPAVAIPSPPKAPPMTPPATPPAAPPIATPVSAAPFSTPEPESMAFTIDEPEIPSISPVDEVEIIESMEEPQFSGLEDKKAKKKKPSKKDEKAAILSRIEQELPGLPDKKKKNIVKELLKRPDGKLRETWFKVYVHKNKQYATKPA